MMRPGEQQLQHGKQKRAAMTMITPRCMVVALCLLFSSGGTLNAALAQSICTSDTNEFHMRVNLFAGEFGYISFEECDDGSNEYGTPNPTIGLEVGQTYTFVQSDISNYFHPLGFAYYPDGAHDDKPELEPIVSEGSSPCATNATCPAPMYHRAGEYLGAYSNDPDVAPVTTEEEDFGLDLYEPLFYYPLREWIGLGNFSIKLRFDDDTYTNDLFYFCHIHQFMSGRIKLLRDGVPVNQAGDEPPLGYEYGVPGTFDEGCGTFGLDAFQLPHPQCPDTYVCGLDSSTASEGLQAYAACTNAMNCHMFAGMTTGVKSESPTALFIHQMIPHHQNAVNMAKSLLKTGMTDCQDLLDEEDPLCNMHVILLEIINSQNFQIHQMRNVIKAEGYPEEDKCVVEITSSTVA